MTAALLSCPAACSAAESQPITSNGSCAAACLLADMQSAAAHHVAPVRTPKELLAGEPVNRAAGLSTASPPLDVKTIGCGNRGRHKAPQDPPGSLPTPGLLWHSQKWHFWVLPPQKYLLLTVSDAKDNSPACSTLTCKPQEGTALTPASSGSNTQTGALPEPTWQPPLLGTPLLLWHVHTPKPQGNLGTARILKHQVLAENGWGAWTPLQATSTTKLPA